MGTELKLPSGRGAYREQSLIDFAQALEELGERAGFKISARGWCYQMESLRVINKDQFNLVENIINECREKGYLPIDFVAEEEARKFSGVEKPEKESPVGYMRRYLNGARNCQEWYTMDWWDGEEYYIQMVVEKIDLKTLFEPVCKKYHIAIATSKGWSSKLQRAEYARRFKEAEDKGLKCVLLYCGDHDPDGLRISDFLRKNLWDLRDIVWRDGEGGYDPGGKIYKTEKNKSVLILDEPEKLIIDRFGLNFNFIEANNLTWIDNLITASGKNLASPTHPNYHLPYLQDYLAEYGTRKCEANAIVPIPGIARDFCRSVIERYLGADALDRFEVKRQEIRDELSDFRERTGLDEAIENAIRLIDEEE